MMTTLADVDALLAELDPPDFAARSRLVAAITAVEPLPEGASKHILEAATRAFAVADSYPGTPNDSLVRSLWEKTASVDPADVEAVYAGLDDSCRASALRLLAEIPTRAASQALARLLAVTPRPSYKWPVLLPLRRAPRDKDVLLAPMLDLLSDAAWGAAASDVIHAFARGSLDESERAAVADAIVPRAVAVLESLSASLRAGGPKARWEGDHLRRKAEAELLVDLAARLEVPAATNVVVRAVRHAEPGVALAGVLGALRAGAPVDDATLARVAAAPECRLPLVFGLHEHAQLDRFPDELWTQLAFAEASLVEWLTFPTELGRAPDEIELVHIEPCTTADGAADLYLFKFRTSEPHWSAKDGWMVGVAGPFLKALQPSPSSLGWTFSRFEALDAKPLAEHLASYKR